MIYLCYIIVYTYLCIPHHQAHLFTNHFYVNNTYPQLTRHIHIEQVADKPSTPVRK